jgi:protein-S-isoprenylcysteine O-methyltransferase Ste14
VARVALFIAAGLLVVALAAAEIESISEARVTALAGVVVAAAAVVFVLAAQLHMGESWRIGVDPTERTALVQTGFYRWIRNPIYTGMVVFAIGQALMIPGAWSAAAVVAMFVGVEVQVRSVEEPYLRTTHGSGYDHWAARAGRFVPVVGRG